MQYLSPLHIQDGFAYGWAAQAGERPLQVHLWLDGRHVASEFTGATLPPSCLQHCGRPPAAAGGFAFALPSQALDGFPHDVHVGIPDDSGGLHGEVQQYQHSAVRGEVRQQGRQFVGTVWFDQRPRRGASLEVADEATGRRILGVPLAVSPKPEKHGFAARFAVPCDAAGSGPLTFTCRGQWLRGSPLARQAGILGIVEQAGSSGIRGWAFDGADPGRPLELCLRVDGRPAAWFRPNMRRPEIEARLGDAGAMVGLIGFHLPLPDGFCDGRAHRIEVVSADDGHALRDGHRMLRLEPAWLEHRAPAKPVQPRAPAPQAARAGPPPLVSVVVLNRNGERVLGEFLQSWQRHNASVPAEIIVIDHASTDGSLALLDGWRQRLDLRVVALDRNDSFSASCNRGAALAKGDYLLFMNNDIVWQQDALPQMIASLQDSEVGIVGLKLLKAVGESQVALHPATEVQHLGVRFKLNEQGYWPYEAAPSPARQESEHAAQVVPAVTGAVLLCRQADFAAVGGFDESYFYGFEDVEFCLRLSQRLGKLVVSRNDLCALHRHGHTRLSGREISLFDRVQRNAAVLERQLGLWLKQAYWRSLVRGDGYMTSEALTIGIVVDAAPRGRHHTQFAHDALALADQIGAAYPHARTVLLPPQRRWKDAAGLHVLVVGTPDYDVRSIENARPDLLTVAWVRADPARWQALPWWDDFGGHLAGRQLPDSARRAATTFAAKQTPTTPLGQLLAADTWRLRVQVQVPLTHSELDGDSVLARCARALTAAVRKSGHPCWVLPLDQWDKQSMMADVRVTLHGDGAAAPPSPDSAVLNVLWLCDGQAGAPAGWQPRHGRVTRSAPTVEWLRGAMEESVGSTFRPS